MSIYANSVLSQRKTLAFSDLKKKTSGIYVPQELWFQPDTNLPDTGDFKDFLPDINRIPDSSEDFFNFFSFYVRIYTYIHKYVF